MIVANPNGFGNTSYNVFLKKTAESKNDSAILKLFYFKNLSSQP